MLMDESQTAMYTVSEVAQIFRVTTRTIRNWIEKGIIKSVRVGWRVRVLDSEVKRILQNNA